MFDGALDPPCYVNFSLSGGSSFPSAFFGLLWLRARIGKLGKTRGTVVKGKRARGRSRAFFASSGLVSTQYLSFSLPNRFARAGAQSWLFRVSFFFLLSGNLLTGLEFRKRCASLYSKAFEWLPSYLSVKLGDSLNT